MSLPKSTQNKVEAEPDDHWMSAMDVVTTDKTQLPFQHKQPQNQRKHRCVMYEELNRLFDDHAMDNRDDCIEFLDCYKKAKLGGDVSSKVINAEDALVAQMNSMPLADRNTLLRLLTHTREGTLNEDMIRNYPSQRDRSMHLLTHPDRKQREDIIDLEPISEFMHDYCR